MNETKTDRVELKGGVVHLPAEFREVAQKANLAGLEGWRISDVEYGLDIARSLAADSPCVRVQITYQLECLSPMDGSTALCFLHWLEKAAPETVRTWREAYTRSVSTTQATAPKPATASQEDPHGE